jgi:ABC-type sugar transport system ATPase subunit
MADVMIKPEGQDGMAPVDININVVSAAGHAEHLIGKARLAITYEDLRYTVQVKDAETKKMVSKEILKGLTGVLKPARLTAVMGASGAGKTTFLNLLSGYPASSATVSGSIKVSGHEISPAKMRGISGFVHQEDVIMDTMTVREALTFSAMMRLPQDMERGAKVGPRRSRAAASARRPPLPVHLPGSAARHGLMLAPPRRLPAVLQVQRALDVAELLGLTHALDTAVGSAMIKGISGGEKRRWGLQAGWIRLAAPPQARGAAQRAAPAAPVRRARSGLPTSLPSCCC